ncbi:MAG: zinc ribbon domain-containing protein [Nitrospiraceae bacterium]|nr:zinc ribbon domain-containing protein [Nitrospiraceae bacterium]MDA8325795.1 zinc ribbon domain-containing protein [Nitrospiraceae bacterium]
MPAYVYTCKDCGKDFTVFITIKEYEAGPKIKCDYCGSDHIERKITRFFAVTSKKS